MRVLQRVHHSLMYEPEYDKCVPRWRSDALSSWSKKTFSCLGPTGYEYEVLMRALMFSLALFHGPIGYVL